MVQHPSRNGKGAQSRANGEVFTYKQMLTTSMEAHMALTADVAKKFFGSLYDRTATPDLGSFEAAAIRLVASVESSEAIATKDVAAGDKALGLLMLNHIINSRNIDTKQKAALSAAALLLSLIHI